jgi:hypothetical protein
MMERRYDAYVAHVVRPFFLDHFARLDRQIVLVDVLSALNAGPTAIADLKAALTDVLGAFRQGANSWLSQLLGRRIDRILFAATKADLVHHTSHDALAGILRAVIEDAATRAQYAGADIDVAAIAAIRATREATVAARAARTCPASSACRRRARPSGRRFSTARRKPRCSPAICPTTRRGARRLARGRPALRALPPAVIAAPKAADAGGTLSPHPPRPHARVPDRRPPGMSERSLSGWSGTGHRRVGGVIFLDLP